MHQNIKQPEEHSRYLYAPAVGDIRISRAVSLESAKGLSSPKKTRRFRLAVY